MLEPAAAAKSRAAGEITAAERRQHDALARVDSCADGKAGELLVESAHPVVAKARAPTAPVSRWQNVRVRTVGPGVSCRGAAPRSGSSSAALLAPASRAWVDGDPTAGERGCALGVLAGYKRVALVAVQVGQHHT
jgi:hypothetical protein